MIPEASKPTNGDNAENTSAEKSTCVSAQNLMLIIKAIRADGHAVNYCAENISTDGPRY